MLTLNHFDTAIETITKPTKDPQVNDLCNKVGQILTVMRSGYVDLLKELLTMYETAAEHNVDIGREAILDLVERLSTEKVT